MTMKEYAMRLENIFRYSRTTDYIPASAFESTPAEALESGLSYWLAAGLIESADIPFMVESANFGSSSLREYLENEGNHMALADLLSQLENIVKNDRRKNK